MRNSYIASVIAVSGLFACKSATPGKELVVDSSIAISAQPVNRQVISNIATVAPEGGTRIFTVKVNGVVNYDTRRQTSIASRVSGRIERLFIKYNYQPVKRGQLIMEIYSPDLAAAQRELLLIAASKDAGMLEKAEQRLLLLGMPKSQISEVLHTGKIQYRIPVFSNGNGYILERSAAGANAAQPAPTALPVAGDGMNMGGGAPPPPQTAAAPEPVLLREGQYVNAGQSIFTVYESGDLVAELSFAPALAAKIKNGQRLLFHPVNDRNRMEAGAIGLVEPVFQRGQNFTLARVYINNNDLKAGQLLTAYLPVVFQDGWWIPREALWRLGNQSVVFRKEGSVYKPVVVATGAEMEGKVQITTDIHDWKIAASAAYMVDSESFIQLNP
jgi:hypothetical protein